VKLFLAVKNLITSVWWIFWRLSTANKSQIIAAKQHFHVSNSTISKICKKKQMFYDNKYTSCTGLKAAAVLLTRCLLLLLALSLFFFQWIRIIDSKSIFHATCKTAYNSHHPILRLHRKKCIKQEEL